MKMKISKGLSIVAFIGILSQPVFAAGDYAMLAEAVSKLIDRSNDHSVHMNEFNAKLATLDEFNKKREEDKRLLERMDGDIGKLLNLQMQYERLAGENKLQGEDINKLIRDMHESQEKIQVLQSMQGDAEGRRLAERAARLDKQAFDLQGIVAKRNLAVDGEVGNHAIIETNTVPMPVVEKAPVGRQGDSPSYSPEAPLSPLDIDILKK